MDIKKYVCCLKVVPFQDVLNLRIIFHWKFHDYGRFRVCPKRPCRINTFLTENIAKVKRVLPLFLPRIWQPENQGFGSTKKNTKPRPCFFPVHANMLPWARPRGFLYHPEAFFSRQVETTLWAGCFYGVWDDYDFGLTIQDSSIFRLEMQV